VAHRRLPSFPTRRSSDLIFSKYNYPNPSHDNTSVYYTGTNVSYAAAASMSVPPFYCPYPIKNLLTKGIDYYIDGEIRETLSTHVDRKSTRLNSSHVKISY